MIVRRFDRSRSNAAGVRPNWFCLVPDQGFGYYTSERFWCFSEEVWFVPLWFSSLAFRRRLLILSLLFVAKRPLSSSTIGAGLTPPADQLNKKRKITPAQPLTLPVPSLTTTSIQPTLITANTSNPTLPNPSLPSNAASDQLIRQQQALARANANAQRANGSDPTEAAAAGNVNDLQAQRLKMSQRMVENQNQNQAMLRNGGNLVASQMRRAAVGGSAAGVAGATQASDPVQLAQQQLLMQQRQQQMLLQQTQQRPSPPVRQASTTSTSTLAAPPQQQTLLSSPRQPSVSSQSPHLSQQPQSSQQRPLQSPSNQTPQPRQPPKIVWNGEISWTVGGGAKPGNNMVAPIVAALAGNNGHADLYVQSLLPLLRSLEAYFRLPRNRLTFIAFASRSHVSLRLDPLPPSASSFAPP
jgi:hypothetical protein